MELDPRRNAVPQAPVPASQPTSSQEHALQLLADVQNLTHALLTHQGRHMEPAAKSSHLLTATNPVRRDDVGEGLECASFSVYNPADVVVYVAGDGSNPLDLSRGGAMPVPGKSLATFPTYARDIDIGCDPALLAGGDIRVWIFRYQIVAPAFLGRAGA